MHGSLEGYRQETPLSPSNGPSLSSAGLSRPFPLNSGSPPSSMAAIVGSGPSLMAHGHGGFGRLSSSSTGSTAVVAGGGGGSATTLLTLFTASMIGLIIIYIKMLAARLPRAGSGGRTNDRTGKNCFAPADSYRGAETNCSDLRRHKRELLKLSREERVRRLILHHGGRNVSQAIRFLASELKEQKYSILKSFIERKPDENVSSACACLCHANEPVSCKQQQGRQRSTSAHAKLESVSSESGLAARRLSDHDTDH